MTSATTIVPRGDLRSTLEHDPWAPLQRSAESFPDGAPARVEIPSVEGPACLEAVLDEAARLDVPVTRASQGSGVGMLTDREIRRMADIAASAGVEVSLFARPGAGWDASAMSSSAAGAAIAAAARGPEQLAAAVNQIRRAADLGIRSVLVADFGVLAVFGELKRSGDLPADMQAKTSVMLPIANAATAAVAERLGASTINVPTDLTLAQIASLRRATSLPLDVYVEAPDNIGGFVRHHEIADLIAAAAPMYVKFGLRNAPDVYPSGSHLEATTISLARSRVRRARLGLDEVERSGAEIAFSRPHAAGLALPVS
ncbi:U32 family peptidase [Agromyces sp. H66]|uniref:U32 family peptidase n=1 Tax=Agromyces sp. H66 TaxID=2529859 RepID=UPI0010A9FBEE|nr:U32 family peptidase [Agromyces sp. H66]